jgi:small-conductance mechanosensitive channel
MSRSLEGLIFLGLSVILGFILANIIEKLIQKKFFANAKNRRVNFLKQVAKDLMLPAIFCVLVYSLLTIALLFKISFLNKIEQIEVVLDFDLIFKLCLIWSLYILSNFSSIPKNINRFFVLILVAIAIFKFLGFDARIINSLANFKVNFSNVDVSLYGGVLFIFIFAIIFWCSKILLQIVGKTLEATGIHSNVKVLIVKFLSVLLVASGICFSLVSAGFDIKSLTIFGSAIVVGLGFGVQRIVSNIMSGITISLEGIIKEGDVISLMDSSKDIQGVVKKLNMRNIVIASADGKDIIIPNDNILTGNIANLTHSNNISRIGVELTVPFELDLHNFKDDILILMHKNKFASTAKESVFNVANISEIGVHCILYFWIDDPTNINLARTDLLFDILTYFTEHNIKLSEPCTQIKIIK